MVGIHGWVVVHQGTLLAVSTIAVVLDLLVSKATTKVSDSQEVVKARPNRCSRRSGEWLHNVSVNCAITIRSSNITEVSYPCVLSLS